MPWTERQQQMLREMGLRVWQPDAPVPPAPPGAAPASGPIASAVPAAAARPLVAPPPAPAATPLAPPASTGRGPESSAPGDAARREAIATMDWPALRESVAACTACGLCRERRQTVFGVGHARAHWMIVGEAPGEQEDRQGEPFVGPAGHLLDNMLHALQLTRAEADAAHQVFIANTLKCRPPRNRNPEAQELAACEPFLMRQIELVRPRIILAMGRFAVQSLLRSSEPIGRLRGRVHRYQGVPLVVTYHPAYLLRNPADKARAWDDLCLAARTAHAASGA